MTNLPLPDTTTVRPFAYSKALVARISLGLSAYVLLGIYPAYGLLRGWWMGDFSSFSVGGLATAATISVAFGLFANWTILKYLKVDK